MRFGGKYIKPCNHGIMLQFVYVYIHGKCFTGSFLYLNILKTILDKRGWKITYFEAKSLGFWLELRVEFWEKTLKDFQKTLKMQAFLGHFTAHSKPTQVVKTLSFILENSLSLSWNSLIFFENLIEFSEKIEFRGDIIFSKLFTQNWKSKKMVFGWQIPEFLNKSAWVFGKNCLNCFQTAWVFFETSKKPDWPQSGWLHKIKLQCPLGFATFGKAAALALATSRALTDLRQYINSDLGFSDLEIWLLYSK